MLKAATVCCCDWPNCENASKRRGCFDPDQKQALPFFPRRIAVLTAKGSAALTDVQRTAALRCPATELLLHHIPVKVMMPRRVSQKPLRRWMQFGTSWYRSHLGHQWWRIDGRSLVLQRRGGGPGGRKCQLPVVSAIGHERDESLIDLVADVRASTPTQAIMKLLPDREEELEMLAERAARLQSVAHRSIERRRLVLQRLERAVQAHHPQRALAARQQDNLVQLGTDFANTPRAR